MVGKVQTLGNSEFYSLFIAFRSDQIPQFELHVFVENRYV